MSTRSTSGVSAAMIVRSMGWASGLDQWFSGDRIWVGVGGSAEQAAWARVPSAPADG